MALVEQLVEQVDFILGHTLYMRYDCTFFDQTHTVEFVHGI